MINLSLFPKGNDGAELRIQALEELFNIHKVLLNLGQSKSLLFKFASCNICHKSTPLIQLSLSFLLLLRNT